MSSNFVVFLPGLLGSSLNGPDGAIWPPTVIQYGIQKYIDRTTLSAKLRQTGVMSQGVVRRAGVYDFYESVLRRMKALRVPAGSTIDVIEAHYEWRQPVRNCAEQVAEQVQSEIDRQPFQRNGVGKINIALVGHSMGGLVARTIVETDIAKRFGWVADVRGVVTIATPHLGSVHAIQVLTGNMSKYGLDGPTLGRLALEGHLNSLLDLLPAADQPIAVELDARGGVDQILRTSELLQRHHEPVFKLLQGRNDGYDHGSQRMAEGLRYYSIASGTKTTTQRLKVTAGRVEPIVSPRSGDTEVAIHSAILLGSVPMLTHGDHLGICNRPLIQDAVLHIFGLPPIGDAYGEGDPPDPTVLGRDMISLSETLPLEGQSLEIHIDATALKVAAGQAFTLRVRNVHNEALSPLEVVFLASEFWLHDLKTAGAGDYAIELLLGENVIAQKNFTVFLRDAPTNAIVMTPFEPSAHS